MIILIMINNNEFYVYDDDIIHLDKNYNVYPSVRTNFKKLNGTCTFVQSEPDMAQVPRWNLTIVYHSGFTSCRKKKRRFSSVQCKIYYI